MSVFDPSIVYELYAYPLKVTVDPAVYAVPDANAGALHAGNENPVPPADVNAFLIARSYRLLTVYNSHKIASRTRVIDGQGKSHHRLVMRPRA